MKRNFPSRYSLTVISGTFPAVKSRLLCSRWYVFHVVSSTAGGAWGSCLLQTRPVPGDFLYGTSQLTGNCPTVSFRHFRPYFHCHVSQFHIPGRLLGLNWLLLCIRLLTVRAGDIVSPRPGLLPRSDSNYPAPISLSPPWTILRNPVSVS